MIRLNIDTYKRLNACNTWCRRYEFDDINKYIQNELKTKKNYYPEIMKIIEKSVNELKYHCIGVWITRKTIDIFSSESKSMELYIIMHKKILAFCDKQREKNILKIKAV